MIAGARGRCGDIRLYSLMRPFSRKEQTDFYPLKVRNQSILFHMLWFLTGVGLVCRNSVLVMRLLNGFTVRAEHHKLGIFKPKHFVFRQISCQRQLVRDN